jgi:hypothetical protein
MKRAKMFSRFFYSLVSALLGSFWGAFSGLVAIPAFGAGLSSSSLGTFDIMTDGMEFASAIVLWYFPFCLVVLICVSLAAHAGMYKWPALIAAILIPAIMYSIFIYSLAAPLSNLLAGDAFKIVFVRILPDQIIAAAVTGLAYGFSRRFYSKPKR